MSDFKFCPHCGSGLATQGDFCGSCGKPLTSEAAAPPPPAKKGFSTKTGIIILVVGLLVLAGFSVHALVCELAYSGTDYNDPERFSYTFVGPLDQLDYAGHKRRLQRIEYRHGIIVTPLT